MKAKRVMTVDVVCIPPELPLPKAWHIMERLRIRHLPVTTPNGLAGILSDRDVLRRMTAEGKVPEVSAGEAMTLNPVYAPPGSSVSKLAGLMIEHRIDCVPILGLGRALVGLVTSTDLLRLLTETEQESDVLPFSFAMRRPEELLS